MLRPVRTGEAWRARVRRRLCTPFSPQPVHHDLASVSLDNDTAIIDLATTSK